MRIALGVVALLVAAPAAAAVTMSMSGLVDFIVALIIVAVIFGLLYILVDKAPFIVEPWKTWIKYVLYFIAILMVINFLLGMLGHPVFTLR